jgi:hypothetical protein
MTSPARILQVGEEPPPLRDGGTAMARPGTPAKAGDTSPKASSRGRFECVNAFVDVTMARLDRAELAVWLLLWRDTKPNGLVRTSQGDLARRAGCSPRTVRRALVALQRKGLVILVSQGGLRGGPSIYRVEPIELSTTSGH